MNEQIPKEKRFCNGIHYEIRINKKPLLVIPCQLGLNNTFFKRFKYLDNFSTLLIEPKNHGKSVCGDLSIAEYAKEIYEIIKIENVEKYYIVGLCFNTAAVLHYCMEYKPDRCILINPILGTNLRKGKLYRKIIPVAVYLLNKFGTYFSNKKNYDDFSTIDHHYLISQLYKIHKNGSLRSFLKLMDEILNYRPRWDAIETKFVIYINKNDKLYCDNLEFPSESSIIKGISHTPSKEEIMRLAKNVI
mgnify:CR=1 FL=1